MKRIQLAALTLATLWLAACVSVTNYVGDSAIRAAAPGSAALSQTNSLSSSQGTNAVQSATGVHMRGGIILSTTINKNVSPATSTALQYIP